MSPFCWHSPKQPTMIFWRHFTLFILFCAPQITFNILVYMNEKMRKRLSWKSKKRKQIRYSRFPVPITLTGEWGRRVHNMHYGKQSITNCLECGFISLQDHHHHHCLVNNDNDDPSSDSWHTPFGSALDSAKIFHLGKEDVVVGKQ